MRKLVLFGLLVLSLTAVGCSGPTSSASHASLLAQHFRETQAQTQVPHGSIDMNSITPIAPDKVRYQTVDTNGIRKTWEVTATRSEAGGYSYATPVEVPAP